MQKKTPARIAAILILALALSGCNKDESGESTEAGHERSISVPTTPVQTTEAEETLSAEQMDLIKYNYYVDLNNDIVDIMQKRVVTLEEGRVIRDDKKGGYEYERD